MTNKLFQYIKIFLLCLAITSFLAGNVPGDQSLNGLPKEKWAGDMTGMCEGPWAMDAWQIETDKNEFVIKGKIKMKLKAVSGGYGSGTCNGTVKGTIKDGVLQAKFIGTAYVVEGESQVSGPFTGTLSETKGSGTYNFATRVGRYTGEWTLEKQ